ncbi:AraC family transcriptional regulator [Microbacterium sp. P04]|uniref:AraC family transcriptional regulator n=1 Tax=Microbacterium sp. P04 TaxID=3366947 RepID=UPI003746C9B9
MLVQMSARTMREAPAHRVMSRHDLGGLALSRIASVAQTVTAQLHEVPSDAADSAQVQLVHTGRLVLEQDGRQTMVRAGEMVIYDVSRPFSFVYPEEFRTTIVQVPMTTLGVTPARLHSLSERPAPDTSTNRLLAALTRAIDVNGQTLGVAGRAAVSRALVNAIRPVTGAHLGTADTRAGLLDAARHRVRGRLGDPGLTAASLAAELHVSVRTLHAAFEDAPETLRASIRRLRLERARHLLLETNETVSRVALSVGYVDVTHFIRSFREATGATPAQWRRERLGTLPLETESVDA